MRIKKIFEYQKDKLWEYDDWSYDIDREEATFIIQDEDGTTFEPLNFNDIEIKKIRTCVSLYNLPNFSFEVKSGPIELVDGPKYKKEIEIKLFDYRHNINRLIIIFKGDDDYFFVEDEDGYKCDTIDGVIQLFDVLFANFGTISESEVKFRELKLTITNYIENSTIVDVNNMSNIVKIIEGK